MSIEALLSRGRAAAESLMLDTCVISRPGAGEREYDKDKMRYTDPDREVVYGPDLEPHRGKCRIQIRAVVASITESDAGGRVGSVQQFELQLPVVGTDGVTIDDVVEITSAAHDPSLVGRQFTVKARHEKSQATARRLPVVEGTA
jgi:hypothetical protein